MTAEPEKPVNLLWAIDEIIIMLQQLRERIRRIAREEGSLPTQPWKPRKPRP
jgi:hypothetical protein